MQILPNNVCYDKLSLLLLCYYFRVLKVSELYVSFTGLMPKDVDPSFVHWLFSLGVCVGGGGQKFALEKAWS